MLYHGTMSEAFLRRPKYYMPYSVMRGASKGCVVPALLQGKYSDDDDDIRIIDIEKVSPPLLLANKYHCRRFGLYRTLSRWKVQASLRRSKMVQW